MLDLSGLLNHEFTKEALLGIVAFLLRSAVKLLKKIYKSFNQIEKRLTRLESIMEVLITQQDKLFYNDRPPRRYPYRRYGHKNYDSNRPN